MICPLCLTRFAHSGEAGPCTGCRAGGGPVALMPLSRYLAEVDFAVVESYWRGEAAASPSTARRVLERLEDLKAMRPGPPATSGGVLLGV
jgi:hypothetical protein